MEETGWQSRSEQIIGTEGILKLKNSKVAVIGIGGVGSFTVEALARAGIGKLVLVDNDLISITNINRQIHALRSTLGLAKVEVMKKRILDINPEAQVYALKEFFCEDSADDILKDDLDFVVDAIDTIKSKIVLIKKCKELGIPIISSMGAGNKLDPTLFKVADISQTSVCPMARVVRRELRKYGIETGVKVVYSTEHPIKPQHKGNNICPGSISFVPSVAGLIMAGEVIRNILNY